MQSLSAFLAKSASDKRAISFFSVYLPRNTFLRTPMNNVSKLKVVVGYTVMLAVLFFSLYFVHREMANLTQSEGQSTLWIDSLSTLLKEKDANTVRILRTLAEVNDSLISASWAERIITSRDTVVVRPRVQHRRVVHTDTVVTQPVVSRGFFRRLRDAFVPSKQDSAVQVKTSVEYATDTLLEVYNPLDTLQARLKAVVEREREANTLIHKRKHRLQQVNTQLSARIDTLLRHYEEKTLERAKTDATYRREVRLQSAQIVGGIAVGAVLLAALFLLLIGRDITRSNRYRNELEEARRRAENLLATREKMMLAITHDFKAPLGSIIGYTDLLERQATVDGQQLSYLENMRASSQHLLKLVTDLLDFHRLEQHKADINRVPFCPAELLDDICVSFRPLTVEKGLQLNCRLAPELSGTYVCDPLRLRQIVTNLLSNAVKFTDRGSITLTAGYEESRLVLVVSDTGRGMEPADRERIFHEFTRLPGAQGEEGFGLGLSIVKMLVQLLGGTIEVESTLGKGSSFTVRIPMSYTAEAIPVSSDVAPDTSPALCDVSSNASVHSRRLLLIDDDRIQLSLTTAMLKQKGIETVACLQIDDLLDALRTTHFDALLTDVQMPALNGFELLQLLRASNIPQARTIPVIAITARSDMQRSEFSSYGFTGCLHKPFSVQELMEELERLGQLDFSALTAFSTDDPEEAQSILRTFADETRLNAERIRRALDEEDVGALAAVAHKMLPLFTLIGATTLVALLRQLEASANLLWEESLQITATQALSEIETALQQLEQIVFLPSGHAISGK